MTPLDLLLWIVAVLAGLGIGLSVLLGTIVVTGLVILGALVWWDSR